MKKEIIVVAGPTAVGKTKYAIAIAKAFDGEIVSCDSMQLYKYMNIGSAKPTAEEQAQVVCAALLALVFVAGIGMLDLGQVDA